MDLGTTSSVAGLIVSGIGLVVTVLTLRKASAIQRTIFGRQRLPNLVKELAEQNSNLNRLLNTGPDRELKEAVFVIHATLNTIASKWQNEELKAALHEVKRIKTSNEYSHVTLGHFYAMIGGVTISLEQSIKDEKWKVV